MRLIPCPHCGPRLENEVVWLRPLSNATEKGLVAYPTNQPTATEEVWYCHQGCRQVFVVKRDWENNVILSSRSLTKDGDHG